MLVFLLGVLGMDGLVDLALVIEAVEDTGAEGRVPEDLNVPC